MKIAHVVFEAPLGHASGAALRNRAIGSSLSRYGQSSTIIVQEQFGAGKRHPKRKRSYLEAHLSDDVIQRVVNEILRSDPNLIVVDGIYLSDIAYRLVADGRRVIVDMHNIESALLKENNLARRKWRARLFYWRRWQRARRAEQALVRAVAGVWTCSERDKALLCAATSGDRRINVVPNPVPDWSVRADLPQGKADCAAIFVGHLNYRPNIRAAERLMQRIQPLLRADDPDGRLLICGRSPSDNLQRMAKTAAGVELVSDPAELAPLYARARAAMIPLTEGGGTRLKVLEALALGVPVIATAKAVEGLNVVPGQSYLAAELDEEFVQAALQLTADAAFRARLIEGGRRFVRAHHDQDAVDRAVGQGLQDAGIGPK